MKKIFAYLIFTLSIHLAYGQICGIYRIKYVGSITSVEKKITRIHVPTTAFLEGFVKEKSSRSFIDTTLTDGMFEIEIESQLTTPYNDVTQLLKVYKENSRNLKIKVTYLENEILKIVFIKIDWDDIKVSVIEDGKFGTLFEFRISDQII